MEKLYEIEAAQKAHVEKLIASRATVFDRLTKGTGVEKRNKSRGRSVSARVEKAPNSLTQVALAIIKAK